jgi:hypothetical protein
MIKEGQLVIIGLQKFLVVSVDYYEYSLGDKPQIKNLDLKGIYND